VTVVLLVWILALWWRSAQTLRPRLLYGIIKVL